MVALFIGAIHTLNKRIETQLAEEPVRFLGEFSGGFRDAPFVLHEIEVLRQGMAEMPLAKLRPLPPTDHPNLDAAGLSRFKTAVEQFVQG